MGMTISIIPMIIILLLNFIQARHTDNVSNAGISKLTTDNLDAKVQGVHDLCLSQQEVLQTMVTNSLNIVEREMNAYGKPHYGSEMVSWNAKNQLNDNTQSVNLPRMMVGDKWLGQISSPSVQAPVVDPVYRGLKITATIFQRMNADGDMLRVATNVVKTDGKRAIGTYIPAVNPDGTPNPVIAAVMSGSTFTGKALVVGKWYIAAYKPIKNPAGEIIGMIYTGIPQESAAVLRKAISSYTIGDRGYVFVLDGKGNYIISKDSRQDGQSALETVDKDGAPFMKNIVEDALKLTDGAIGKTTFNWKSPLDKEPQKQTARYMYFKKWDWVIVAVAYDDEVYAVRNEVHRINLRGMMTVSVITIAVLLASLFIMSLMNRTIAMPVSHIAGVADKLATGDLDAEIGIRQADEIGLLAESFRTLRNSIAEKAACASEIADGNLNVSISAASEKDALSKSMIDMVTSLKTMSSEITTLTESALSGKLDVQADVTKYKGDYAKMIVGLNALMRAIFEPIENVSATLKDASRRNLTARVDGVFKGAFAALRDNTNTTLVALEQAISQVGLTVEQINTASGEISSSSHNVAEGTNEQASALEQISASLEEITSMAKQNAANAMQGQNLAKEANDSSRQGNEAMLNMNSAIYDIKKSSDETAKIVKTIDEIAFQTNLLALNAAVEAARAGEAGKGFAVVAEEVRKLAQRSAEAAKNTSSLIEQAVIRADNGVNIADGVAKVLVEIENKTRKVNNLMGEVSAASREQSLGIEQISLGMSSIDKVTQRNAINSQETANAALQLASQAGVLNEMVSSFNVTKQTGVYGAHTAMTIHATDEPLSKRRSTITPQRKHTPVMAHRSATKNLALHRDNTRPEDIIPFDNEDGDFDSSSDDILKRDF